VLGAAIKLVNTVAAIEKEAVTLPNEEELKTAVAVGSDVVSVVELLFRLIEHLIAVYRMQLSVRSCYDATVHAGENWNTHGVFDDYARGAISLAFDTAIRSLSDWSSGDKSYNRTPLEYRKEANFIYTLILDLMTESCERQFLSEGSAQRGTLMNAVISFVASEALNSGDTREAAKMAEITRRLVGDPNENRPELHARKLRLYSDIKQATPTFGEIKPVASSGRKRQSVAIVPHVHQQRPSHNSGYWNIMPFRCYAKHEVEEECAKHTESGGRRCSAIRIGIVTGHVRPHVEESHKHDYVGPSRALIDHVFNGLGEPTKAPVLEYMSRIGKIQVSLFSEPVFCC
jgi:hypothetical protein